MQKARNRSTEEWSISAVNIFQHDDKKVMCLKVLIGHVKLCMGILIIVTAIGMHSFLPALADEGHDQSIKTIFQQYCQDCHGPQRDGRGALRPFLEQDPADLTSQATQAKTDQELFFIIKNVGGVEMHRWGDTLSDEQILGLVRYLREMSP